MTEKKGPGRPEYVPTDEDREKVRVLKATGMSHEGIAVALNITSPTLRKYFGFELEIGAAKVQAEVIMARYRSAMGGNVQAQSRLLEQMNAVPPKPMIARKEPKLGKKEQAQVEAETAHEGSGWGDLLH